jgi:hypothetical protein
VRLHANISCGPTGNKICGNAQASVSNICRKIRHTDSMFRSLPFPRRKPRNCHLESDRIDTCTAFPISGVNIDPLSVATQLTSLCKVPCLVATLGHVTMTTQFRLRVDSLELSYGKDWKWGHTDRDSWKMVKMMYEFLCILLLCKEHTKLPNGTKEKLLANRKSSEWFCE